MGPSCVALHFNVLRILVVGGFQSSSERLSDVWVYSVVSRQWDEKTTPPVQRSTIFSSRGGHSACCMGSHLWVYGGYGGALYSRKDLEDVCILDLETWTWAKVRMHRRWHVTSNLVIKHCEFSLMLFHFLNFFPCQLYTIGADVTAPSLESGTDID